MSHSKPLPPVTERIDTAPRRIRCITGLAALLALALLAAFTSPYAAAVSDEEELTRFGSGGSGAGQITEPKEIAADPTTGHVYVVDHGNNRVSEFTPWGDFVKAFGWNVAPGAVNEQQEIRVRAAEGQFKLTFGASTTPDLAFNAPGSVSEGPGSVEAALNGLDSIAGAGGEVSVKTVPGTPDGKTPSIYVVIFKGSLAGENAAELAISNGTAELKGGFPSTGFEAGTRVDGTPNGTGLESCTVESGCQAGLNGSGAGQFNLAIGVAIDATGNIYIRERSNFGGNNRVQKFDPAGRFLLMFGGEVNETTKENICTKPQLEGGDVCGAGTIGNGNGKFGESFAGDIAFASDKLFVGDVGRIQRFNTQGEYEASVLVPDGKTVHQLAIAPGSGDFYVVWGGSGGTESDVHKLSSATGVEIGVLPFGQSGIATDLLGNVYTTGQIDGTGPDAVLQYGPDDEPLSPPHCCKEEFGGPGAQSLATNVLGDLYVAYTGGGDSFIRLLGPPPVSFEGAPKVPPTITTQFASSVGRDDATVAAEINPHFWTSTRYYVEYGTGKCSEGGCTETQPVPPGSVLTTKVTSVPVRGAGVTLEGLQPRTTYHYRFVAESSGGGPVRGIGGEVGNDGEESTFITYPVSPSLKTNCPNQAFRTGFSAPLPDCRAYEMVSPVDKNNGDIKALLDVPSYSTALNQSATDGGRFTYSSYRGFGDLQAAPYTNQYIASRKDGVGWLSESLDPAQNTTFTPNSFENHYKAFSSDLCKSWLLVAADPALSPGASPGVLNLYQRDNCGGDGYKALVQGQSAGFAVLQGTSASGDVAVFASRVQLTEDAASGSDFNAYYASDGELHLVCVLPSGSPTGRNCTVGTTRADVGEPQMERLTSQVHAISADGGKVYWTDYASDLMQPGKVYLRLNPGEEQSEVSGGECTEAEKACTVKVSETKTSQPSRFLGASSDGARALFEVTGGALREDLYKFDSAAGASTLIASETLGVAAASEDLSRVYFVSKEALPETTGATAGKPNLYLDEEGTKTFVATISEPDVSNLAPSNATPEPIYHAARATVDGRVLAFISTERLTGYDNTDQVSGRADSEVFRYEAGSSGPVCISCNPSGARPVGRIVNKTPFPLATAAGLTMPNSSLYFPRGLADAGRRLFFNSYDALLPRDTNGKGDVYQWEAAAGQNECDQKGAELYVDSSGGCLSLISSGQSPEDSELLDISASGNDVFFTTNASLLPQDPGLIDIYDARAGGGLPAPPEPPGPCQGEACQFAPSPPNDPTPASASFKGAGNASAKPRPRCAKGKARRKGRCVAKKSKRAKKANLRKRAANHNRGANR